MTDDEFKQALQSKRKSLGLDADTGRPVDIIAVGKLVKGEFWVAVCRRENTGQAMRKLGEWASDPQLAFTWYDAAAMSAAINQAKGNA